MKTGNFEKTSKERYGWYDIDQNIITCIRNSMSESSNHPGYSQKRIPEGIKELYQEHSSRGMYKKLNSGTGKDPQVLGPVCHPNFLTLFSAMEGDVL